MKRILALILVVLTLTAALSGCGEQFAFMCRSHGFKGDYNITAIDERFIPQQKVSEALNELKLDTEGIYNTVFEESRNGQKA